MSLTVFFIFLQTFLYNIFHQVDDSVGITPFFVIQDTILTMLPSMTMVDSASMMEDLSSL
jgi:hypothetical protein